MTLVMTIAMTQPIRRLFWAAATALLLSGCTAMPDQTSGLPVTFYDAPLAVSASGEPLDIPQLAARLQHVDVVVVGEYHGHQAGHLLQARLQAELYQRRSRQILSLEQFNADHQGDLDRYLQGDSGEEELIEDADAWANYQASYRPVVEFARTHQLPVVAANAPAQLVRCVGRLGPGYLETLDTAQQKLIPEHPFAGSPAYRAKFFRAIGGSHGTAVSERMENSYHAQLLRDNTMAQRIIAALAHNPDHQVLHLTGTFHSEERLGTVAALQERRPELTVAVISPVFLDSGVQALPVRDHAAKGDYLYFLLPLPEDYRDPERRRKAMMARFDKAPDSRCD